MRRFLLFLGTLGVGLFTVLFLPVIVFSGDIGVTLEALVGWGLVLVVGLALSTPFFIGPRDGKGPWFPNLPVVLQIPLIVVRVLSWIGYAILRGIWWIIYKFWDPRPAVSTGPTASTLPHQVGRPGYPQPQPQPVPAGAVPASWQNDPTGRFTMRYWDGQKWTEHVANGSVMAIDPI